MTPFVRRITLASCGTAFVDGFNMIVASVALTLMGDGVFTTVETGLYASLYVVGVFLAAFLGGKIGDRFGRTVVYRVAPVAIAVVSLSAVPFHGPYALLLGRFLTGVFVGADYPMANTMVSEFTPGVARGKALVILMFAWYVGALAGSIVGYAMYDMGDGWPWLLASTTVPAILFFLLRMGIPESTRWLAGQGRVEEAQRSLDRVFGPEADVADLLGAVGATEAAPEDASKATLGTIFRGGYLKRFVFVAAFWVCQCAPVTVVFMFGPTILQQFGLGEGRMAVVGTALVYVFFMLGVMPAIKWIACMPRRTTVIATYVVMAAALLMLGIFSNAGPAVVVALFALYALPYGLQSVLDNVYPPELFPTEVRGTAIGTLTAVSKLGGATASFLFPIGLAAMGLGAMFVAGALISLVGLVASVLLAPETMGKSLEESSSL